MAIPILIFGLLACKPLTNQTAGSAIFGFPLIFKMAHQLLAACGSHAPAAQLDPSRLYLHPVAVAAWVGMFATALNLIPGGQLDGGHIVFAINPRAHRTATVLAIVVLLPLGWFVWATWLLWAVVLRLTGRHPDVPNWPGLDLKRRLLALFGLLMLVLTFSYNPLMLGSFRDLVHQWLNASK